MKIAIDIDGVVANTVNVMKRRAIDLGFNLKFKEYVPTITGIDDPKPLINDLVEYILVHDMDLIYPYPKASEQLKNLATLGDITFLTARAERHKQSTKKWLKTHFPIRFDLVHRGSDDKVPYLLENKFDVFIEDRLRTVNQAAASPMTVFLISRTWNRGRKTEPNVYRVQNMGFAYATLLDLRIGGK